MQRGGKVEWRGPHTEVLPKGATGKLLGDPEEGWAYVNWGASNVGWYPVELVREYVPRTEGGADTVMTLGFCGACSPNKVRETGMLGLTCSCGHHFHVGASMLGEDTVISCPLCTGSDNSDNIQRRAREAAQEVGIETEGMLGEPEGQTIHVAPSEEEMAELAVPDPEQPPE